MDFKERISNAAKDAFDGIQKAEEEFRRAGEVYEKYKNVNAGNPVEMAKVAMAKAEYEAAQASLRNVKRNAPGWIADSLAKMRKEYAAEVERRFGVDASDIDMKQLELLKSGIMRPGEYHSMIENAAKDGNPTMVRLIAKYAADAAEQYEKKHGVNDPETVALRMAARVSVPNQINSHLETFDSLADVVIRCVNNPAMVKYWDSLSQPLLERL